MVKKMSFALIFLFALFGINMAQSADSSKIARLEKRIKKLEDKVEESELEKILNEAEAKADEKEEKGKTTTFKSGQRSLQAINPEISVTGDQFALFTANENKYYPELKSGAYFRVLGIHIQSNLDPFSFAKVAVEINPEGIELGEVYATWTKFLPQISLTAGKFRQQFGVVNRWHAHSLDQFDFPLAMTTILGADGLNQTGLSFDWTMPSITADANSLILQITNGQNDNLFAGEVFTFPSVLARFKNYWDLSRNAYLELGFTGMYGRNKSPIYDSAGTQTGENNGTTLLGGLDLTYFWEPLNQALYKSFIWRSELYYGNKELYNDRITALGGYSYIEYKFAEQWQAGARFDYTQPFEIDNSSKYSYQIVPYITYWQSHWVKLRLQYNYLNGTEYPEAVNTIRLQLVWAVGPHKHDRY
ncbi:MAG: hypothetical protein GXO87_00445 [Chlorobi bacterium]|nr:hypothetical protein [Chlorobiota bacterium]